MYTYLTVWHAFDLHTGPVLATSVSWFQTSHKWRVKKELQLLKNLGKLHNSFFGARFQKSPFPKCAPENEIFRTALLIVLSEKPIGKALISVPCRFYWPKRKDLLWNEPQWNARMDITLWTVVHFFLFSTKLDLLNSEMHVFEMHIYSHVNFKNEREKQNNLPKLISLKGAQNSVKNIHHRSSLKYKRC